ncbi:MAG: FAD-binding oxidoreductase, partial [Acidimicrobiia bacterium]|nr:FAD-binding oxidoreductase [Acidimicrobiia bacterium]
MTLVADLVTQLGEDKVLSEPLERYLYGTDGGVARGEASVVVLPRTAEEVSAVVKIAQQYDSPIVPRGAGTGLAGGAAPAVPALVISLTRMTDVDIDLDNHTAWVGPGVINLDLSKMTRPAGYHFAPDPSSQSACTI